MLYAFICSVIYMCRCQHTYNSQSYVTVVSCPTHSSPNAVNVNLVTSLYSFCARKSQLLHMSRNYNVNLCGCASLHGVAHEDDCCTVQLVQLRFVMATLKQMGFYVESCFLSVACTFHQGVLAEVLSHAMQRTLEFQLSALEHEIFCSLDLVRYTEDPCGPSTYGTSSPLYGGCAKEGSLTLRKFFALSLSSF